MTSSALVACAFLTRMGTTTPIEPRPIRLRGVATGEGSSLAQLSAISGACPEAQSGAEDVYARTDGGSGDSV